MTAYLTSLTDSLVTLDSLSNVMPNWLVSATEAITTDDTLAHHYTAVRSLIDATGASTLGVVNLPLLFTYLPSGLGMDIVTRQTNVARPDVETLNLTDIINSRKSFIFPLSESLILTDNLVPQQSLIRLLSESIPYNGDSLVKHLLAYRAMTEQVGQDLSISPMLMFPLPQNDILTRHVSRIRATSDTLSASQALTWLSGFSRAYTESLTTSDSILRRLALGRHLTDTLSFSDVSTRHLTGYRTLIEALTTADTPTRHLTLYRTLSQSLTTSDSIHTWHWVPRSISETLTTQDSITLEQLLGRIMGYIWVDQYGNVIANMPDWGFTLIEDPISGNSMNVIPVSVTNFDPTREK